MTKVEGDIAADFKWLVQLLCTTQVDASQRILFFFHNLTSCLMLMNTKGQGLICRSGRKIPSERCSTNWQILIVRMLLSTHLLSTGWKYWQAPGCIPCFCSLWMGMNFKKYLVCHSLWHTSDSRYFFVQDTGTAVWENSVHGHSIQMAYSRMFVGRKPDDTMKTYVKKQLCLENVLLAKYGRCKPEDLLKCCDFCEVFLV